MSHIDRLRRALALHGEADPDTVIADLLSGESPFTNADLDVDASGRQHVQAGSAPGTSVPAADVVSAFIPNRDPAVPQVVADAVLAAAASTRGHSERRGHFELSANAIDLEAILGAFEPLPWPIGKG